MAASPDSRAVPALLGVAQTAPWEEVRRAFRDAVRASHPDLHTGDSGAERRLKTLNAAWELVNTPAKWSEYVAGGGPPAAVRSAVPTVGRLRVLRARVGSAGLRRWKLELDGDVVGTVENGATHLLDAVPGRHSLRVFYDSCSSPVLAVALHAGEELVVGCRQQSNPLLGLYARRRSLVLELVERRRIVHQPR